VALCALEKKWGRMLKGLHLLNVSVSSILCRPHFLKLEILVGECRREYMVGASKALAGSNPVADSGSGVSKLSSILVANLEGLRRMQEELH
jgi:hypothetical protein